MIPEVKEYQELLFGYDREILKLVNSGDFEKARWVAEESYEYSRCKYGDDHIETAKTLNNLAWIYDLQGHYQAAEIFYKRSIGLKKSICGGKSVDLIPTMENLTSLYLKNKKYPEAENLLWEMIDIVRRYQEPWNFREAVYLTQMANIKLSQNQMTAAEGLYFQIISFIESTMPADHPNLGRAFANIADFFVRLQNYRRAEFYYKRAAAILKRKLPKKHPDLQSVTGKLADIQQFLTVPMHPNTE